MRQTGWCLNLGEEADVVYFATLCSALPFYVHLHISFFLKISLCQCIILFPCVCDASVRVPYYCVHCWLAVPSFVPQLKYFFFPDFCINFLFGVSC